MTTTPRTDAESKRFNTVDSFDDRDTIPADFAIISAWPEELL